MASGESLLYLRREVEKASREEIRMEIPGINRKKQDVLSLYIVPNPLLEPSQISHLIHSVFCKVVIDIAIVS